MLYMSVMYICYIALHDVCIRQVTVACDNNNTSKNSNDNNSNGRARMG